MDSTDPDLPHCVSRIRIFLLEPDPNFFLRIQAPDSKGVLISDKIVVFSCRLADLKLLNSDTDTKSCFKSDSEPDPFRIQSQNPKKKVLIRIGQKNTDPPHQCGRSGSVEPVSFSWIRICIKKTWIRIQSPDPNLFQIIRI